MEEIHAIRGSCHLYCGSYPANNPQAAVLITHGLGDHGGRYGKVVERFLQSGLSVMVPDLRGNGKSGGQRGYVRRFEDLLDDLDFWLDTLKQRHPGRPVISYGHSFGGMLVLFHSLRRRPDVAGVIATSPSLRIAMTVPRWKVALARTLGQVFPRISLRTKLDLGELSDDPEHERKARADELMHGRITPRLWFGMVDAGQYCLEKANQFPSPCLIMHGEKDRITDASATREFAESAPQCTWREWAGGKHELHNMAIGTSVADHAANWIKNLISA
jgi:alpha-beta hydrolase superfamily lysophospholipase